MCGLNHVLVGSKSDTFVGRACLAPPHLFSAIPDDPAVTRSRLTRAEIDKRELLSKFIYHSALPPLPASGDPEAGPGPRAAPTTPGGTRAVGVSSAAAPGTVGAPVEAGAGAPAGPGLFLDEDGMAHTHTEPRLMSSVPVVPPPPEEIEAGAAGG